MPSTTDISLDFAQDPDWESADAETRLLKLEQATWRLRAKTALVLFQRADSRSHGTAAAWLGPPPTVAVAASRSDQVASGRVAAKKATARAPQQESAERVKDACLRTVELLKKAAAGGNLSQSLSEVRDSFHAELNVIRVVPPQEADSECSTRASSAMSSALRASHPDRFVRQEVSETRSRAGQVFMRASLDGTLRGALKEIRASKPVEAPLEDQTSEHAVARQTNMSEQRSRAGQVLTQASMDDRLRRMLKQIRTEATEPQAPHLSSDLKTRAGQVLLHASTNGRMLSLLKEIRSSTQSPAVSAGADSHMAPVAEPCSKSIARPSSGFKRRTKPAKAKTPLQIDDGWATGSAAPLVNQGAFKVAFNDGRCSFRLDAGDMPAKSKRDSSITKGYDTLGAQFFNINHSPKGAAPPGRSAMEMDLAGPVGLGVGSAPLSSFLAPQTPSSRPSRALSLGAPAKVSKARPLGATVRGLSVGGRMNDASAWSVGGLAARPGLVC